MKQLACLILIIFPLSSAWAGILNCGSREIGLISVQGDREGSHHHENRLVLRLSENGSLVSCSGNAYLYLDNSDPAFSGILSTLLSAQAQGKKVDVFANGQNTVGGNTAEIAWITLNN